jgi:hypothetical protein
MYMLAMIPPPVIVLILIGVVLFTVILWIKLKNSKGVDKLTDNLFNAPVQHTVDEAIDSIKDGKDALVQVTKDNAKKVKDLAKESAAAVKGLKK